MVSDDVTDDQCRSLAYTLVTMAYMWMQNSTIYHDPVIPRVELSIAMRDLIRPLLTDQGAQAFSDAGTGGQPQERPVRPVLTPTPATRSRKS